MFPEPRQILANLEQGLLASPPEGLEPAHVRSFFFRHQLQLRRVLSDLLIRTRFRPSSRWGGRAGDDLGLELASPGERVVTAFGAHGVVLEGPGLAAAEGNVPVVSVHLDSGRNALVGQVFFELEAPRWVEPDVLWAGSWVAPEDFLAGLAQCLETLVDVQAALRGEKDADRRLRWEARAGALRTELAERANVWGAIDRRVALDGARLLGALVRLELDTQWAGSQGLDWLRTPNAQAAWREIPSGIMVVRPLLDGERGLTMGWTRIKAVREGELGSLEAVFGPRDAVPLWSVRRVR